MTCRIFDNYGVFPGVTRPAGKYNLWFIVMIHSLPLCIGNTIGCALRPISGGPGRLVDFYQSQGSTPLVVEPLFTVTTMGV